MRTLIIAAAIAIGTVGTANAQSEDLIRVESSQSVADTVAALEQAIEGSPASVFTIIDHGANASDADMELGEAQLVLFGNPQVGTQAMQADIRAGLLLPMRVLVYAGDDGTTYLTYQDPEDMFDDLDIDDDAEFIGQMQTALDNLTSAAAGQ